MDRNLHDAVAGPMGEALATLEEALLQHASDQAKIAALTGKLAEQEQVLLRVADLETKLAAQDKVILEKVAAGRRPFAAGDLQNCLTRLVNLHLLRPEVQEKVASELQENPNRVFGMMLSLTQALMSTPSEGQPLTKEADTDADADPDGWWRAARGLPVAMRS